MALVALALGIGDVQGVGEVGSWKGSGPWRPCEAAPLQGRRASSHRLCGAVYAAVLSRAESVCQRPGNSRAAGAGRTSEPWGAPKRWVMALFDAGSVQPAAGTAAWPGRRVATKTSGRPSCSSGSWSCHVAASAFAHRAAGAAGMTQPSSTVTMASWVRAISSTSLGVQRLDEAHVHHRGIEGFAAASSAGCSKRAEGQDGDALPRLLAAPPRTAAAQLGACPRAGSLRSVLQRHAHAFAARVAHAQAGWFCAEGGGQRLAAFVFVGRRQHGSCSECSARTRCHRRRHAWPRRRPRCRRGPARTPPAGSAVPRRGSAGRSRAAGRC